tara:strand:+ start:259 stop:702 length:444 start_codon:yes stop_codon:yes gene_type:complete
MRNKKLLSKLSNASAAIIIDEKKRLLLQKRDNNKNIFFPNHWGCFGGAKEKNENYMKCIKREILEEIGLNLNSYIFLFSLSFNLKKKYNFKISRYYFFIKINNFMKKKIVLNEGSDFKFFSFEKLNNLKLAPYDYHALTIYNYYYSK